MGIGFNCISSASLRFLLPAVALLGAALHAPAAAKDKPFESVWDKSSTAEACSTLDQIALKKISREPLDAAHFNGFHERVRGKEAVADGSTVIRVGVSGGMTSSGIGGAASTIAVQVKPGLWHVSHMSDAPPNWDIYGPLGPPSASHPAVERPGVLSEADFFKSIIAGSLDAETAARLEATLAAPCIDKEPPSLPMQLPLKAGGLNVCPPDSARWVVDIKTPRGSGRYARPCQLVGPVGHIIRILSSVRLVDITRRFDPDKPYQRDDSATLGSVHAFVAQRIKGAAIVRKGTEVRGRIAAYTPKGCEFSWTVAAPGDVQSETVVRHWKDLKSLDAKPFEGAVDMGFAEGVHRVELGSTIAAIKLYNALFYLMGMCQPESAP